MFCLTVLGNPVTKKRARIFGKARFTPDIWYEEMVAEAFSNVYPDSEPYGSEFAYYTPKGKVKLKKGYSDSDLPKLEVWLMFYCRGGKVGDCDNYIKSILDALNELAWVDDRQIKHIKPYVFDLDEEENKYLLKHDEKELSERPRIERVDILVKSFNSDSNQIKAMRNIFDKYRNVVDLTVEYYDNNYREWKHPNLWDEAYSRGLIGLDEKAVKRDLIQMLIEYDKKEKLKNV